MKTKFNELTDTQVVTTLTCLLQMEEDGHHSFPEGHPQYTSDCEQVNPEAQAEVDELINSLRQVLIDRHPKIFPNMGVFDTLWWNEYTTARDFMIKHDLWIEENGFQFH